MTNALNGFDIAIAIPEASINLQLESLLNENIIRSDFRQIIYLKLGTQKDSIEFNAQISSISLKIVEDKPYEPLLILSFGEMTITTTGANGKESMPVPEGVVYAFNVKLNKINQQYGKEINLITAYASDRVQKTLDESGMEPDNFTIQSLLLDFDNSNITQFDLQESDFQPFQNLGLSNQSILFLGSAISDYYKNLSKTNNPYILGYSLALPTTALANTFIPSDCYLSTSYSDAGFSSFNFLLMTDGNTIENPQSKGILPDSLLRLVFNDNSFLFGHQGVFLAQMNTFNQLVMTPMIDLIEAYVEKMFIAILRDAGLEYSEETQYQGIFGDNCSEITTSVSHSSTGLSWEITIHSTAWVPIMDNGERISVFFSYDETISISPMLFPASADTNNITFQVDFGIDSEQYIEGYPYFLTHQGSYTNSQSKSFVSNSSYFDKIDSIPQTLQTSSYYDMGTFEGNPLVGPSNITITPILNKNSVQSLAGVFDDFSKSLSHQVNKNLQKLCSFKTIFLPSYPLYFESLFIPEWDRHNSNYSVTQFFVSTFGIALESE